MKLICLTQNKFTQVDDEDYDFLNQFKWCAIKHRSGKYYAVRGGWIDGKMKLIYMHRVIMNTPEWMLVDHIYHNGLDNRKSELRNCTHTQNQMNRRKQKNCSSKYFGVCWYKINKEWGARIKINGKQKHIGFFKTEVEAAKAYNIFAKKYLGEFANLNFKSIIYRGV